LNALLRSLQPRLGVGAGVEGTGNFKAFEAKAVRKLKADDRLVLGNKDNEPVWTCCIRRFERIQVNAPTGKVSMLMGASLRIRT